MHDNIKLHIGERLFYILSFQSEIPFLTCQFCSKRSMHINFPRALVPAESLASKHGFRCQFQHSVLIYMYDQQHSIFVGIDSIQNLVDIFSGLARTLTQAKAVLWACSASSLPPISKWLSKSTSSTDESESISESNDEACIIGDMCVWLTLCIQNYIEWCVLAGGETKLSYVIGAFRKNRRRPLSHVKFVSERQSRYGRQVWAGGETKNMLPLGNIGSKKRCGEARLVNSMSEHKRRIYSWLRLFVIATKKPVSVSLALSQDE